MKRITAAIENVAWKRYTNCGNASSEAVAYLNRMMLVWRNDKAILRFIELQIEGYEAAI